MVYRPLGGGAVKSKTETIKATVGGTPTTQVIESKSEFRGDRLETSESTSTTTAPGQTSVESKSDSVYEYDQFGSMLTIRTKKGAEARKLVSQYTYDPFERLLSARDTNGDRDPEDDPEPEADGSTVYCYDALDRRDRRVTGVESVDSSPDADSFEAQRSACRSPQSSAEVFDYAYMGASEDLSRERGIDGKVRTYDYTADGDRLGQARLAGNGTPAVFRPYEKDGLGNVVGLELPGGGETPAQSEYRYDPYGRRLHGVRASRRRGSPLHVTRESRWLGRGPRVCCHLGRWD